MEVDALLILFLSVAAFTLGKAGAWVLLIGSMRYGFLLAQVATEALRGELSPSIRRKTVCVIQVATLCLLLLPVVGPPLSGALAGVALFLLIYSFGVDVIALLNAHRGGRRAT
jgi:phosphatidylglycerophosphate synthase